ncbi:MAG: hypothetical protein RI955_1703 [Bacteroidota bacterium]
MVKNLFLTISMLLFSILLKAQTPLVIDFTGKEKLSSHWQCLKATNDWRSEKVLKGDYDSLFKKCEEDELLKSTGKFWMKFSIQNNTNELMKYYVGTSKFDYITFYLPDTSLRWQQFQDGTLFPFKQKRINIGSYSFASVEVKPNETITCYTFAENKTVPSFQFANLSTSVFTEKEFKLEYGNVWIYNLIFLGVVLIMLFYNLMLFFITREKSYLYYLGYIATVLSYVYALSGDMIGYVFANAEKQNDLVVFTGIAALIMYAAFSRKVLELKKYLPKWDKILFGVIVITFIAAVLMLLNLSMIAIPICFVAAIFTYPAIIVVAYRLAFKMKYVTAKYFFIAASFYITMLSISFYQMLGLLPVSIWGLHANHFTQIGVAVELALFSLALGAKINQMRKEKFEAQQLVLEASQENEKIIREQNVLLEQKVNERTSELNQTLEDLKHTQKQLLLNEKMASLGQLMAGIAHEINNPINFVSSNIAPLKRDFADIETLYNRYKTSGIPSADPEIERIVKELDIDYTFKEVAELLNGIEVGAKRTAEIVKGLKTFSRMDEVEKVNYDLEEGLEGTLLLLSSKIDKKEIVVEKHFGTIPMVNCFSGKINQVFMNIIANAIDASTEKGKVIITTKIENDNAIILIEDNGMGMSEETQAKIFDPFFTTKDVGSGTGLGLSITYGIIESHNGKIEVNSEVGKGTEFIITLPIN